MNIKRRSASIFSFAAIALGFALFAGCGKHSAAPPEAAFQATATKSAEPNSFADVAKNLDAGGNLYLYLSTEQWLSGLADKVAKWKSLVMNLPMGADDQANANKGFDLVTRIINDSGVEDVSGFGVSSVALEKDFYRTKMVLHHYQGKGSGFGWSVFGKAPHALNGLDFAPADTAMVFFGDFDFAQLWSVVQDETKHSGFPEAQQALDQLPAQFKTATGLDLNQVLASLGTEYGMILTLDASNMVTLPLPTIEPLEIPEPGILIVAKVGDDTIFNRLEQLMVQSKMEITRTDKDGLKMRSLDIPIPLPVTLQPTIASANGYLFISTSPGLVEEALAVKSGQKPGLRSTDEFKRLAKDLPTQGNCYGYMSQRFGEIYTNAQQQFMSATQPNQPPAVTEMMHQLMRPQYTFSVVSVSDEGFASVAQGNQNIAVMAPVAVGAVGASMLLPAIAAAKQKAAVINARNHQQP